MGLSPYPAREFDRSEALSSLANVDHDFPASHVSSLLARPENAHLLEYVTSEAFTHVFPGDIDGYDEDAFFRDLDAELAGAPEFHLWAEVPLCRYRCHFCQFPILVVNRDDGQVDAAARRWVDANLAEARLWLDRVPALRSTPVGEFCVFGGTPTAIPPAELARLTDFYLENFNFTNSSSMRLEGSPDSLSQGRLQEWHAMGYRVLTYGIQSFDDRLLELANRRHTGADASKGIVEARASGFTRVDGDLVWGLPGQDVAGFLGDVEQMIRLEFSTVIIIKLHLRDFDEVTTAIGNVRPAAWESPEVRRRIEERGYAWPSLGKQYQMREQACEMLNRAGYYEHPTTYFPSRDVGAERWRVLNLDQRFQLPQVGIGLGGYAWTNRSEASTVTDPKAYLGAVERHEIPLEVVTGISDYGREIRSLRMSLSTCQQVADEVHIDRFGHSLMDGRWRDVFAALERRELAAIDRESGLIGLTQAGQTLVEAIINTEIV